MKNEIKKTYSFVWLICSRTVREGIQFMKINWANVNYLGRGIVNSQLSQSISDQILAVNHISWRIIIFSLLRWFDIAIIFIAIYAKRMNEFTNYKYVDDIALTCTEKEEKNQKKPTKSIDRRMRMRRERNERKYGIWRRRRRKNQEEYKVKMNKSNAKEIRRCWENWLAKGISIQASIRVNIIIRRVNEKKVRKWGVQNVKLLLQHCTEIRLFLLSLSLCVCFFLALLISQSDWFLIMIIILNRIKFCHHQLNKYIRSDRHSFAYTFLYRGDVH